MSVIKRPERTWRDVSYRDLIPVNADALYALNSRGFGGEIGLVSTNMKWCGAFLFGAIVLPIVILNFVVAFVFPKFFNNLDLASQFRFFCGRVDGTLCALDAFPSGCISGHASLRSYCVVFSFVFQPFFRAFFILIV